MLRCRWQIVWVIALAFMWRETAAISIDAHESEITAVLQQLSAQSPFDVVVGPGIKGKVTLFLSDVDIDEALEALATAGGWAVYREKSIYRFVTQDVYERAKGKRFGEDMVRELFSLKNLDAAAMAQSLTGFTSPGGRVSVEPESNTILVYDRRDVVAEIRQLINDSDRAPMTTSIELKWVTPEAAAEQVRLFLGPSGVVFPDLVRSRVVVRDQPFRVEAARALVEALDTPLVGHERYVPLHYVTADSMADLADRLQKQQPGSKITPVGSHGLLIEGTPGGIEHAVGLISKVDSALTTIRIDTKILQVSVSREISTGIDWQVVGEKLDDLTIRGSFPIEDGGSTTEITFGDIADDKYSVLFNMLESLGEVELISRPSLVALSGYPAELVVGSRVPYATTDTREDVSGIVNRYQRVIYVDVGLNVWVMPFYHSDGQVTLTIRPEISSITGYVEAEETQIPVVETTNANITATVPLGKSVVLGGLIRDSKSTTSRGVPLLRSIPLLGALFRYQADKVSRGELVILLTPEILETEPGLSPD